MLSVFEANKLKSFFFIKVLLMKFHTHLNYYFDNVSQFNVKYIYVSKMYSKYIIKIPCHRFLLIEDYILFSKLSIIGLFAVLATNI